MKTIRNISSLAILLLIFGLNSYAQKAVMEISKDSIIIGDQVKMQLMIPAESPDMVAFPSFQDTIVESVFVLNESKSQFDEEKKLVSKTYTLSAFESGIYTISPQEVQYFQAEDTLTFISDPLALKVLPAVVVDTLPVDTVYAEKSGVVIMGRGAFAEEIEQQIPDSIKKSLPADSLNMLKEQLKQSMSSQFAGQVFRSSGLRAEKDIQQIVDAPKNQLFIVNDKNIREEMRIPGAFDTVFVQEFDTVIPSQALYTVYDIKDIHDDVYKTKFNFKELMYYIWQFLKKNWWWLLAVVVIALAAIYYFLFYKKGKPVFQPKEKVIEPAHVIAFRELERIRNEKLWLKNQVKEYYTELTDTFRRYLENRFDLSAMEKTSAEILDDLNTTKYLDDELVLKIRVVLERADFVKFARSMPLPDENEHSLKVVYEIVERSKLVEVSEEEKEENDKQSNN